VKEEAERAETI